MGELGLAGHTGPSPKGRFTSRDPVRARNPSPTRPTQPSGPPCRTRPARTGAGPPPPLLGRPRPPTAFRPTPDLARIRKAAATKPLGHLVEEKEGGGTGNQRVAAESACAPSTLRACVTIRAARFTPPIGPAPLPCWVLANEAAAHVGECSQPASGLGPRPPGHVKGMASPFQVFQPVVCGLAKN